MEAKHELFVNQIMQYLYRRDDDEIKQMIMDALADAFEAGYAQALNEIEEDK